MTVDVIKHYNRDQWGTHLYAMEVAQGRELRVPGTTHTECVERLSAALGEPVTVRVVDREYRQITKHREEA